jgi:DNA repair photolyase
MEDEDIEDAKAGIAVRGRGTGVLAKGRFERLETFYAQGEARQVETEIYKDTSRSILSTNDSPDLPFRYSLNPYRGCEHGCIYCFARPFHEYLGLSAGLDFETKIFAKPDAARLLREKLSAPSWKPETIVISGVTDCYQPVERELQITRSCMQVLTEFRNPCAIITKNHLVTRDIDLLAPLAQVNAACVTVSLTTLDRELARRMEPRASTPARRLQAIEELSKAGIPVNVNMAPIIPGLTDHEIPQLLRSAAGAGARSAHYTVVRLPHGVKDLFAHWLDEHYPLRKDKVLNHIRDTRGGKLYDAQFGARMTGTGVYADQIAQLFDRVRETLKLNRPFPPLSAAAFRPPRAAQLSLFDERAAE